MKLVARTFYTMLSLKTHTSNVLLLSFCLIELFLLTATQRNVVDFRFEPVQNYVHLQNAVTYKSNM